MRAPASFLALLILIVSLSCSAHEPQPPQTREGATAANNSPVILLTGFEPFGDPKSPNASWEGVRQLDGQSWKGYQLVCKQMQVVWGAPLAQLQQWNSLYHPVAIFCFGQGSPGYFALESKAVNLRGQHLDNKQQEPPGPTIVEDGPQTLNASSDCLELSRRLSAQGYPVRVSEDAGKYLCEEALYSLEYLKSSGQLTAPVLFCHVPPLGSRIQDRQVDAPLIQQFVGDTLETWYTAFQQPDAAPAQAAVTKAADASGHQEVEAFIRRYFQTWSDQDMDAYGRCFASNACIQFIDPDGRISLYTLAPFLTSQRESHRRARHRQTEVAESIDIRFEAQLARVVAYWKLTAGPRTEFGYDHFTLIKQQGQWRIANLVFYAAEERK
jgi:pyroglutamyl-peptidase